MSTVDAVVDEAAVPDAEDDRLGAPKVTPEPAPPDDQLFRLAGAAGVAAAIAVLITFRWLRRNVDVRLRRG